MLREGRGVTGLKQFSYVLTNDGALQGRRVGNLSREASRFSSTVRLASGAGAAALCQAREVAALGMRRGSRVTVTVEGTDEEAAVAAIQDYFVANL